MLVYFSVYIDVTLGRTLVFFYIVQWQIGHLCRERERERLVGVVGSL